MIWIDNVLAVPAIGILIRTKLSSADTMQGSFGPLLEYLDTKYGGIKIERPELWGY